jgi:agmatinase
MIIQSTNLGGIFGLISTRQESAVILTPVPWEITTSYGSGTSRGPKAILEASPQIDLFDIECGDSYKKGYYLETEDPFFMATNDRLKPRAQDIINNWDETAGLSAELQQQQAEINAACAQMTELVYQKTKAVLAEKKIPGLIGGDHSTPLGAIRAISEHYKGDFGILHIDAHADLRLAYQGFTHSHASIMRNVCQLNTPPKHLVQVGIRDFCQEEYDFIQGNPQQITTFFDSHLKTALLKGESWQQMVSKILKPLPNQVYVSFDIDGLAPQFCPHTGTPVPGGLSFDEACFLMAQIVHSGRKIVGFDLNEVAPGPDGDEWDGNVGSRLLFKLCGWSVVSNQA